MVTDEQKQKIVQEILQTPIIVSNTYYGTPCFVSDSKNNHYIISGQRYEGCSDEDMCDFSVGYYRVIYGQVDYMYGEALYKPEMKEGNPIRLYSLDEITEIFCKLGLRICNSFADFSGKPSSDNDIQLMVYSIRE